MKDPLDRLPPLGLRELFEMLAQREVRPRVTLNLDSGHTVTGHLLAASEGHLLLRQDGLDATYLPVEAVRAVTVHYGWDTVHVLSRGAVSEMPDRVPSRLELRRRLQEAELPTEVDWEAWPDGDLPLARLGSLLTALEALLLEIRGEHALEGVRIQPAGQTSVEVREGVLLLSLALRDGDLEVLPPDRLRREVERIL